MKIYVRKRFDGHPYMLNDQEVVKLREILTFYEDTEWHEIPDFEKIRGEDVKTSEEVELPVNALVF